MSAPNLGDPNSRETGYSNVLALPYPLFERTLQRTPNRTLEIRQEKAQQQLGACTHVRMAFAKRSGSSPLGRTPGELSESLLSENLFFGESAFMA